MADGAKIVKRMIDDKRAEIFHSSAYGRAQSGGTMGAASTESFAERQKIDENRQNIRKYNDSMVAEQRFNKEAAGSTRLDQPAKTGSENGAGYYEDMLKNAKKGMEADIGDTKRAIADARIQKKEAEAKQKQQQSQRRGLNAEKKEQANLYTKAEERAEMSARFAGGSLGQKGPGQTGGVRAQTGMTASWNSAAMGRGAPGGSAMGGGAIGRGAVGGSAMSGGVMGRGAVGGGSIGGGAINRGAAMGRGGLPSASRPPIAPGSMRQPPRPGR